MPRPVTPWEWFTFVAVFGSLFITLTLLRGCYVVSSRNIKKQRLDAQVERAQTLILTKRLQKRAEGRRNKMQASKKTD